MLEIFFVIFIYRKLKKRLGERNQNLKLAWLGPVCWVGGEIFGGSVAGLIMGIMDKAESATGVGYLFALLCAAIATAILFICIYRLPQKTLSCPKCGLAFKGSAKWGITCESCDSRLKVVGGRVEILETA